MTRCGPAGGLRTSPTEPWEAMHRSRNEGGREANWAIDALRVGPDTLELTPGGARRAWMDRSGEHFAYRCLPMVLANQHGWLLRTRCRVCATWDGSPNPQGVKVQSECVAESRGVSGHFGFGILTWTVPFLFRTPPGIDLLLRGPSNWPIDGAAPLEGLIETAWSPATATMNWQITRSDYPVVFAAGDPVAMIVPIQRTLIESCRPVITHDVQLRQGYQDWAADRSSFLAKLAAGTAITSWQQDYQRGSIGHFSSLSVKQRAKLVVRQFEE